MLLKIQVLHNKNKTPVLETYIPAVLGVKPQRVWYLFWLFFKIGLCSVQPYHSKVLGESFPLMWLNIVLHWKTAKIRTTLVTKIGLRSPKRYCVSTQQPLDLLFAHVTRRWRGKPRHVMSRIRWTDWARCWPSRTHTSWGGVKRSGAGNRKEARLGPRTLFH